MENNEFVDNQAYLSGNAVYVRFTKNVYGPAYLEQEKSETCGGGFHSVGNIFANNTSVIHSSNGGAISLECEFVTASISNLRNSTSYCPESSTSSSSSQSATEESSTAAVARQIVPVQDPVDFSFYQVDKTSAWIYNNTFEGNEVGQKGSAIYSR